MLYPLGQVSEFVLVLLLVCLQHDFHFVCPICLPACLSIHLSACLSVHPSVCLPVRPSICLSDLPAGTWYTTYTRVPHYITSHLRSLYLHSLEYTEFDLTGKDTVLVTVDSRSIVGGAMAGN